MSEVRSYPNSICPKIRFTDEMMKECMEILQDFTNAGVKSDIRVSEGLDYVWFKDKKAWRSQYFELAYYHFEGLMSECCFHSWLTGNWREALRNAVNFIKTLKRAPDFILDGHQGDVKFCEFRPPFLMLKVPIEQLNRGVYDIYVLTTSPMDNSVQIIGFATADEVLSAKLDKSGKKRVVWHGHLHPVEELRSTSWQTCSIKLYTLDKNWRMWNQNNVINEMNRRHTEMRALLVKKFYEIFKD